MTGADGLNRAQREAVTDTEGAVLVYAGAGSGKTRVLVNRVIYLMKEKGIPSRNILAITFTNKATREMTKRLAERCGENDAWVSTFHSMCARILRAFAEDIGYDSNFTIYDESATRKIMRAIVKDSGLAAEDAPMYLKQIERAKNKGWTPKELFEDLDGKDECAKGIAEVYAKYDAKLFKNNAMDFDDLLIKCRKLLTESERARRHYSERFRYIHVDEYQDTNPVQFDLLKILSGHWGNIFAVGDDDQNIYSWRGANVEYILDFDKTFPGVKIHKLEQNYRSTKQILECANRVISQNFKRADKTLYTELEEGERVSFQIFESERSEARRVAAEISRLRRRGCRFRDIAILMRKNSLTLTYELELKFGQMPYRVYGGNKFFDRKEVLDVVAYLRAVVNRRDDEAIDRIMNFPPRGIGEMTKDQVAKYAKARGMSLADVVTGIADAELPSQIKNKIRPFKALFEDLVEKSRELDCGKFVEYLVEKVGFEAHYAKSGDESDAVRWDNVDEFVKYATEQSGPGYTLDELMQTVALNTDAGTEKNDFADAISISTMHAAKGLEFPVVFIVDCEEGIIPSSQCIARDMESGGNDAVEEERRVMYVAMTRAQKLLYVYAINGYRFQFRRMIDTIPSRFFFEARGAPFMPNMELRDYVRRYAGGDSARGTFRRFGVGALDADRPGIGEAKPKVYNRSTEGYVLGAKVRHERYGEGCVIQVSGEAESAKVAVAFPNLGVKKFVVMNAPLTLI